MEPSVDRRDVAKRDVDERDVDKCGVRRVIARRRVLRLLAIGGCVAAVLPLLQACAPAAPMAPAAGSPAAGAPSSATSAAGPRVGGTLRVDVPTDPDTLDPHLTSNPASSRVFTWFYPQLVYQDYDKSYKPWLAERIDIAPDNSALTFTLRQGPKFENGDAIDANAVKFTFDRLKQIGTKSPLFEVVKNFSAVDALDARTVRITLDKPQASIFHDLATAYGGILSPRAVQTAGDNYARQPVSSGAYRLQEWKTGQEVILQRNADYAWPEGYFENRGAAFVERLNFRVVPEPATARQLFEAGELDRLTLSAAEATKYDADARFHVYKLDEPGIAYLGFNCQKPPFTDRKLRQALSHAVNKDDIVRVALGGEIGKVVSTPLPPSVLGFDASLGQYNYAYDPAAAKRLLGELGYQPASDGTLSKDGQPLRPTLYTSTDATYAKVVTLLQAQMKAVGVDLQIKTLESGVLLQTTPKGEHDLLLLGWNWNEPDALFLFLSKSRLQSSNRVLWVHDRFDQLVTDARAEMNQAKRLQMYQDAQRIVLEEAPWQPLYMPVTKVALTARLQNVKVHPAGALLYHDAWLAS
jgi:peptide/nickel transport system substrate-binding protein